MYTSNINSCLYSEQTISRFKNFSIGFNRLLKPMLVILFCVAMMQSLTAQKTLTVKKVKQISSSKAAKISQTQFQMKEKIKFMKMLDGELFVSQRFERTLQDNGTYIDERGYHQMTFEIIKKTNGDFALVYAASTENLDIYSKGIIFSLAPDLTQRGNAMIITRNDEELRSLKLNESFDFNALCSR